jgi:hypothetical protein
VKAKLPVKKAAEPDVPLSAVVDLFRWSFKRGPWPNESQCYYLTNDINGVRYAKPAQVLNDDPSFRRRCATINAMQKLIREQREYDPHPGLRFPAQIEAGAYLEALEKALDRAKPALMGWGWLGGGLRKNNSDRRLSVRIQATIQNASI